jgi:hypothetical protein
MNGGGGKKFGGGRVPTGTPSLAWSSVVVVVSLLAGASIVHNIYKPDMVSSALLVAHLAHARTQPVRSNACPLTSFDFLTLQTLPPVELPEGGAGDSNSKKS